MESIDNYYDEGDDEDNDDDGMVVQMVVTVVVLLFLSPLFVRQGSAVISCRNRYGTFIAYKLPKISAYGSLASGVSLYYADSNSLDWEDMEDISSSDSAIASTLEQYYSKVDDDLVCFSAFIIYTNYDFTNGNKSLRSSKSLIQQITFTPEQDIFYLLYNDEHPDGGKKDFKRGHAKGVVLFDADTGFFMVHSVPNFPSANSYEYPESGMRNGQSFLCITMNSKSLTGLAQHLYYIQPSIYASQLPTDFASLYPTLQKVIAMKPFEKRTSVYYSLQKLPSAGGVQFIGYGKYKKYGKDLYRDLVAVSLKETLYVETWLNGPGDLESSCDTKYKVFNVLSVNIDNFPFTNSKDHSKWAVTDDRYKPYICIGDINRQVSQTKRSGGTVCLKNGAMWKLFRNSIERIEECGKPARKNRKYYKYQKF
ncbi:unnamed protein product [Enterobius vermicularis]|uniref:Deoxyribonuclease II n=1 Tax=Enterobius vermicularis TaxID=51028 RepID=A0A0N4UZS9_ENTVE|nr:unnamed protein product [Enterobius vermicularis]